MRDHVSFRFSPRSGRPLIGKIATRRRASSPAKSGRVWGRPWEHLRMWLTSFDLEPGYGPIEVNLICHASIGQRADWAWATLEPPLRTDGNDRDRVLLGARHQGDSVWSEPVRWPVHVYVCIPEVGVESRNDFTREQVNIAYWGLLHQSRERAEIDQY